MNTRAIMLMTSAALLPGIAAYAWFFGWGVLINIVAALITAVIVETLMLKARGMPMTQLLDGSICLTAILLALCLPPLLPIWMLCLGVCFAVVFGKHLYGGVGNNLFNPAMCGFAALIISFPLAMSFWPESPNQLLQMKFALSQNVDGVSRATPLDAYKFREGLTNVEFFTDSQRQNWQSWMMINLAFLAGGIFLLLKRIINWHAPVAMLATLLVLSTIFYDSGSSNSLGSPALHLFSGATMLAAFFIVTDPVTNPASAKGLLIFGAMVGLLTFVIRTTGAYPEGIAFAVLLMNAAVPIIDHVLMPKAVTT